MSTRFYLGYFLAAVLTLTVQAAENKKAAPQASDVPTASEFAELPPPPPPDVDAPDRAAEELEPEITITTKGTEIHEEYRLNGQLYMIRVTPSKGPTYYLVYDERGNARRSDLEPDVVVPQWVIKRF